MPPFTRSRRRRQPPWLQLPEALLLHIAQCCTGRELGRFLVSCRATWSLRYANPEWALGLLQSLGQTARYPLLLTTPFLALAHAVRHHPDDLDTQVAGCRATLTLLRHYPPGAAQLTLVAPLADALRRHHLNPTVAEYSSLSIILICSSYPPSRRAFANAGAITAILFALHAPLESLVLNLILDAFIAIVGHHDDLKTKAVDSGAISTLVSLVRRHPSTQNQGSIALNALCSVQGAYLDARRQAAVDAGAFPAFVYAAQLHPNHWGLGHLIFHLCRGIDAPALLRKQAAADAGVIQATLASLRRRTHRYCELFWAASSLLHVCQGTDPPSCARKQTASDAGAFQLVVEFMRRYPTDRKICRVGADIIETLCSGSDALVASRRHLAAEVGALALVSSLD